MPKMGKETLIVDGYEVSVTFADSNNPKVIDQVKQILLSSFSCHIPVQHRGDTLANSLEMGDNISGDTPYVP